MISASDLTYFIEVTKTLNLSRAAERIGISQPSLSLAIKRIEDSLGTDILVRSTKGVVLTRAGEKLLFHSKSLLQYWSDIKAEALASEDEVKGRVTIGCHPSVGLYTLEKFIPKLISSHKELEFSLTHDLSRNITEQIISFKIDIGLVINPVQHPDLIIKKVLEDKVSLWTTGKNEDVLICDPELLQTQGIQKDLKKRGLIFKRVITSSSLENITNLANAGAGVGVIPSRVARRIGSKKLKEMENSPSFKDTLSIVYRVENKNVKSISETISSIDKYLGK